MYVMDFDEIVFPIVDINYFATIVFFKRLGGRHIHE